MAPHSLRRTGIQDGLVRPDSLRTWLTSPATMVVLSTAKQSFFAKRKYVDHRSADIIDLIICIFSIIGALSIIIPYCFNRRSRKLRHSLILGLATSDMVSSLIITSTTSFLIAGGDLTAASKFCSFAGYAFATSIWTQHLWNLSIASITYMILVHPLSPLVSKFERHLAWLWPLFWAVALIVNGAAWSYVGFVNSDGYCALNSQIHGNFSAIFQFLPRSFVVVVILVLYTRLFFFLRRINLFSAAISTANRSDNHAGRNGTASQRSAGRSQNGIQMQQCGHVPLGGTDNDNGTFPQEKQSHDFSIYSPVSSLGRKASTLIAKVRRTDSSASRLTPSTLVGGDVASKRNGSASSQGQASSSCARGSLQDAVHTIEYRDAEVSPLTNTSADGKQSSQRRPSASKGYRFNNPQTVTEALSFEEQISPKSNPVSLFHRPSTGNAGAPSRLAVIDRPNTAPGASRESLASSRDEVMDDDRIVADHAIYAPMSVRRDVRDFGMTSPPQEHLKHYSLSAAGVKIAKKALAEAPAEGEEDRHEEGEQSITQDANAATGTSNSVTYEDTLGVNWTWGMAINGEGGPAAAAKGTADDRRISIDTGRATRKRHASWWIPSRKARASSRSERGTTTSSTNSSDGDGVETTGSTLNRQASVLLLLYPAAYVLLFSVSIIRFLVDISTSIEHRDPKRNSDALHTIARWTIFAQGAIDALVFQLIERQFRRRMKRRRRIAAGEQVDDTWAYKAYVWARRSMQRSVGGSQSTEKPAEQIDAAPQKE